jgi:hypothetical protein
MDGGMGRSPITPKVDDATSEGADGAEYVVAASSVANFFTTVGILLVRELEDAESSSEQLVVSSSVQV